MKFFAKINKVEDQADGSIKVYGYASTEAIDSQGEIVKLDAVKNAWDEYMQFANVREMHQPSAVGVVKKYAFDDKGVQIESHIVDSEAVKKVKSEVYKGFSIGGKKLATTVEKVDGKDVNTVTKINLIEISLVDRPANPEARIELWKRDESADPEAEKKAADEVLAKQKIDTDMTELSDLMDKNKIDTTALINLVKKFITSASITKGMYTVGQAASLLEQLDYLVDSTEWESKNEGDNSPIPAQLREICKLLGEALKALVTEEVDEMNAGGGVMVEMADMPTSLIKFVKDTKPEIVDAMKKSVTDILASAKLAKIDATDVIKNVLQVVGAQIVEKKGARNNKMDSAMIQKMHDAANTLGAKCMGAEKHEHTESLAKIEAGLSDLTKISETITSLQTQIGTLTKSNSDLAAELEKVKNMPLPPKGQLKGVVVEKTSEINANQGAEEVQPIMKADGTVDESLTLIKTIQAKGGAPLAR